jgi:hypothetical protein
MLSAGFGDNKYWARFYVPTNTTISTSLQELLQKKMQKMCMQKLINVRKFVQAFSLSMFTCISSVTTISPTALSTLHSPDNDSVVK